METLNAEVLPENQELTTEEKPKQNEKLLAELKENYIEIQNELREEQERLEDLEGADEPKTEEISSIKENIDHLYESQELLYDKYMANSGNGDDDISSPIV